MSANLEAAILANDLDGVRRHLEMGVEAFYTNDAGVPYVTLAALFSGIETLELLVGHGADVNQDDRHGSSALAAAASCGRCESVRWLLEAGADVDATDASGDVASRAIWQCVFSADSTIDTLRALVEGGAALDGVDRYGRSLVDWATNEQLPVLDTRSR